MFDRGERLKELFKELVVDLLREVKDPGLSGFLTVAGVDLSADRKNLKVYYSILGTDAEKERAGKALERAAPYLRSLLKKRVTVKVVPEIQNEPIGRRPRGTGRTIQVAMRDLHESLKS